VFAVPGEITSALSSGTNDLLKLGASPLTASADVLDVFGLANTEAEAVDLGSSAEAVLARLRDGPASADELARVTGLDAGALASALTELELAGCAVAGGGVYRAQ
jgi:DNA processing protein